MTKSISRRRWYRFSLCLLIVLTIVAGIKIALLYRQVINPPSSCISIPGESSIWIGVPTDQELLARFVKENPEYATRQTGLFFFKEKITDHADPSHYLPFVGQAHLHRVRYKCRVYSQSRETIVGVMFFNYDHYDAVHPTR